MPEQVEPGSGTPPPVVAPPPPQDEFRNKYEEEKRKREQMEQELQSQRDYNLRMMAQQPVQQPAFEAPAPEDEFVDENTKKYIARKEAMFMKAAEERANQVYHRNKTKDIAVDSYPDLKNPSSEFFRKVAYFMDTHKEKYNDPEGLLDACARVAVDMKITAAPRAAAQNEVIRQQASSGAAAVEGAQGSNASVEPELEAKGNMLASKLGIDPKKMAARLRDMDEGKGVYAPREGKTGKASI